MAQEIERKFLVAGPFKEQATRQTRIVQGYLSSVPERTVRVRIKGDKGFLTIKGIGNASGASRYEWEREIPVPDVEQLLAICEPGVIDKVRWLVPAARDLRARRHRQGPLARPGRRAHVRGGRVPRRE